MVTATSALTTAGHLRRLVERNSRGLHGDAAGAGRGFVYFRDHAGEIVIARAEAARRDIHRHAAIQREQYKRAVPGHGSGHIVIRLRIAETAVNFIRRVKPLFFSLQGTFLSHFSLAW